MAGAALAARWVQKPWQGMLQKPTAGRGATLRVGSNQPNPREGRAQTAQGGSGARAMAHAASASPAERALNTRLRIACRLNLKVSKADAW